MDLLPPDAETMRHAMYTTLKPCPFCGQSAGAPMDYYNGDSGVYRTIITCQEPFKCGGSLGYNALSRNSARSGAIDRWEKRA